MTAHDGSSLTRQICDAFLQDLQTGRLKSGDRVMSTRRMAETWGVNRSTVTAAYEQLSAEGYLITSPGAPSRVSFDLATSRPQGAGQAVPEARLSDYGLRLGKLPPARATTRKNGLIGFRSSDLAAADFPAMAWKKMLGRVLQRRALPLSYGENSGAEALKTALCALLRRTRTLTCDQRDIVIVNGTQQGIDLCSRLLLNVGDTVVMENPGYGLARQSFAAAGATVLSQTVDGEGLITTNLPSARLAFVTPSHQYPLGGVLSVGRRHELLDWAAQCDAFILEDDYDSEYRFDVGPIPPLHRIDPAGRVIYIGSLSRTLSPALRIGYIVAPPSLRAVLEQAKRLTDRQTPGIDQEALALFIQEGHYERHIRRLRRAYTKRRARLLSAVGQFFGDRAAIQGGAAGLHIILWLRDWSKADEAALCERAIDQGVDLQPIGPFYDNASTERPDQAGFMLGYAGLTEAEIAEGISRLAKAFRPASSGGDRPDHALVNRRLDGSS